MGNLNFSKRKGEAWISDEFIVNGDFNLHVERNGKRQFNLLQKTAGSKFAEVREAEPFSNSEVIDIDVQVIIPKTFKVISYSEVVNASYTEQ